MANPVETLVGPLLLMVIFACIFYGVYMAQAYVYWTTYTADPVYMKTIVILVTLAETMHTGFCMHMIYSYLVESFGKPEDLLQIIWSAGTTVYLMVFIVAVAQGFYIFRIWTLSGHSKLITGIPAVLLFFRCGFSLATASLLYKYPTWIAYRSQLTTEVTLNTGLSLAALVDIIIATLLVYYLYRSRGSFNRTNQIITWLVYYTVETGLLTMALSLTIVFTYNFVGRSLLFAGLVEVVSKLYANSMLAMLNARNIMRNKSEVVDTVELSGQRRTNHSTVNHNIVHGARLEILKETSMITDLHRDQTRSFDRDTELLKAGTYNLA